ncbi:amidohydrolase family protein [Flavonifractor sp.]|uniref:amidohydrolase n=1 Tax=Flavonifractor sp. TaxID=2049025 RepID=UPI0025C38080|nr:amidohydrolase family protein [Flavonifractor sp.]
MKRRTARSLCAVGLSLALMAGMVPAAMAAEPAETADSIYINGNIYTVDDDFTTATAMAVKGDRILYVGDQEGAEAYLGAGTQVTDLEGNTVLPGLIEGHMHISNLGENHLKLDCYFKSKEDILEMVRQAAEAAEPGQWIQGSGWLDTLWDEPGFPTKEELDAVAPDNPVYLLRADNHMGWFNSMALELAGITKDTPDPQGGKILKTDDGELWGCLTDTAINLVRDLVPAYTVEEQQQALLLAQEQLFSYGFTSAVNAGTTVQGLENFKALYESGEMKLRTYPMIMLTTDLTSPEAEYIRTHAPSEELYDNRMLVRGVKIVGDGSLGSRSSAMLEDYSDAPGTKGEYRFTDEQMYEAVKLAYDNGYQTGVHAIGDGTNHQVLNAYERVMEENPREDARLRIEHFQIITAEDMQRALDMGILPAMQFTHATSDSNMAEDRIGSERIKTAYAWRTVLDAGSIIIGGSDAPVEKVNPFHGLYAGVTRMTRAGEPEGGWYPEQKVTREEALRAFTIWAAYGQFEEDLKGSLEPGKLADFIIIDRDYMTCPEADIKDIQVLATYVGNELVYTKDTSAPTVVWQGDPLTFNRELVVEPGTIYVPLSDVVNGISAQSTVSGGIATVTLDGKTASVPVKDVNGAQYVGIRALMEGLGYHTNWYPDGACVSIGK